MMWGKKQAKDLSVEELEQMLRLKQRQARIERFSQLSRAGRSISGALVGVDQGDVVSAKPAKSVPVKRPQQRRWQFWKRSAPKKPRNKWTERLLLGVELLAVATLFGVLVSSYFSLQELNSETALAQQRMVEQPQPMVAPPISVARLPGGHTPPNSAEGVTPDVPIHLQQWVQPGQAEPVDLMTVKAQVSAKSPTRIVIPKIKVDAPIVPGVGWEELKKGVGHLPGSANPGERGNLYLAAHNDIYGEIFRYLEELEVGDDYFIYAGDERFRYVVKETRIIEPTEVEVMLPTTEPVATLQTCHPYLIDTHRLVVISELAE